MSVGSLYPQVQEYGRRKSRTESAVESIEDMIRTSGWQDGFKLPSQRTLAASLGFSRPTVREALVALEVQGRLSIQPGKGVFLTKTNGSMGQVQGATQVSAFGLSGRESQMYQFRYAIEPAIVGLVAVNATTAQIEDMFVVVEAMRLAIDEKNNAEFSRLDFAFHSQMIEAANNRFFTEAITPFLGLFFESQKLPFALDNTFLDTVIEHEKIIQHVRAHRSTEAHEAMERHIRGVAERAGVKLVV